MINFEQFGIKLNDKQTKQLENYYEFLLQYNQHTNLTAITDKKEVYVKHFFDSLLGSKYIKSGSKIIDIGTGAGFPGMVLKILDNSFDITLLDSLKKRTEFLYKLSQKLETPVQIVNARAEDFVKENREVFDTAVTRAVAGLGTICEWCLPYVKVGGIFVVYKGLNYVDELNAAQHAIKILGGQVEKIDSFELPDGMGSRTLIVIKKIDRTPKKYPRQNNLAKVAPL